MESRERKRKREREQRGYSSIERRGQRYYIWVRPWYSGHVGYIESRAEREREDIVEQRDERRVLFRLAICIYRPWHGGRGSWRVCASGQLNERAESRERKIEITQRCNRDGSPVSL